MDLGEIIKPWTEVVTKQVPALELFDAHTHIGQNDPDGMKCTPEELHATLRIADASGCFVFPMHEPDGYPTANDAVIAAASEIPEFVPFCRVNPHDNPVAEAERSLEKGAKGIKLHPRAEEFTLDHPNVAKLAALADERRLPILVHAGRGIPALGRDAVELTGRYPNARVILAHAAICDLAWIWRVAPDHPNLLFDTAWWMPGDLRALFSLVPPGQILFASDAPYGATLASAAIHLRYALEAGLSPEQMRQVAGEQSRRIAAGEELAPAGPAVGERELAPHILLDRIVSFLLLGAVATMRGVDNAAEMIDLADQAAEVPDDSDDAPICAAVRELIGHFRALTEDDPTDRRRLALIILAASVASTPDVPLPT